MGTLLGRSISHGNDHQNRVYLQILLSHNAIPKCSTRSARRGSMAMSEDSSVKLDIPWLIFCGTLRSPF